MNKSTMLHNKATKSETGVVIDVKEMSRKVALVISGTSLDFKVRFEGSIDYQNYFGVGGYDMSKLDIFYYGEFETSKQNSVYYFDEMDRLCDFRAPIEILDGGTVTVEFAILKDN